jgi:hypothetical protein
VLVVQKNVGGGWAVVKVNELNNPVLQGSKSLFRSTSHQSPTITSTGCKLTFYSLSLQFV